jgi:hypothetical protein
VDHAGSRTFAVSSVNVLRAQELTAISAWPRSLHQGWRWDVTQTLWPTGMNASADQAAGRAAGLGGGHDTDPSLPEGQDVGAGDTVAGQVEDGGGSIRAWK